MGLSTRNRRRADTHQRTAAVKATAARTGRLLSRVFLFLTLTLGLVAGGHFGWRWLSTSPTFAIQRVSFVGLQRVGEAELLRLSGLGSGQNVFQLDVGQAERAMAAHPWISKLEISRRLPNGLSVEVVEHAPAALMAMGELYLVNEDGSPFRRVQPGDSLDLLLVTGVDRDAYVADSAQTAEAVAHAIAVARVYERSAAGKQAPLSEARLEQGAVVLITTDGEELRLGEGGLEEKLTRLAQVRRELTARSLRAQVIHLDNRARPDWVAVKVWDPGSERTGGP